MAAGNSRDGATVAQCDSDVERRMLVKGKFGGINNSVGGDSKKGRGEALSNAETEAQTRRDRGPESNKI